MHARFSNVDLEFSDCLARGEDLPVHIRQAHPVVIDEIERTHAGARQRLDRIAAHAADAEYGHAGA